MVSSDKRENLALFRKKQSGVSDFSKTGKIKL